MLLLSSTGTSHSIERQLCKVLVWASYHCGRRGHSHPGNPWEMLWNTSQNYSLRKEETASHPLSKLPWARVSGTCGCKALVYLGRIVPGGCSTHCNVWTKHALREMSTAAQRLRVWVWGSNRPCHILISKMEETLLPDSWASWEDIYMYVSSQLPICIY